MFSEKEKCALLLLLYYIHQGISRSRQEKEISVNQCESVWFVPRLNVVSSRLVSSTGCEDAAPSPHRQNQDQDQDSERRKKKNERRAPEDSYTISSGKQKNFSISTFGVVPRFSLLQDLLCWSRGVLKPCLSPALVTATTKRGRASQYGRQMMGAHVKKK